jgi:cytochrome c peroxidase
MKTIVALVAAATLVGCQQKKNEQAAPTASAQSSASAQPEQAAATPRPSQGTLPKMPPLNLPNDPQRAEKVALGHDLFFDKRLSGHNDRACFSCHENENGTGGKDPLAIGSGGKKLDRHTPPLWNVGYYNGAFGWAGEAKTLEEMTQGAWAGGPMGVGDKNLDKKAAQIAAIPGYKKLFTAAYPKAKKIQATEVVDALADYMRTLTCTDTKYDKYAAGDKSALSDEQQRGLDVFMGKGQCFVCHAPPYFSTAMATPGGIFFNIGVGTEGPPDKVDVGRMAVTHKQSDWAAFRPPSLRDVAPDGPYFHNGSRDKLEDAVKVMAGGGIKNKNETPVLADRKLSKTEFSDLIAFLNGLDCSGKLEQPQKLP